MPTFIRRPSPPVKGRKDYHAYKQEVREDFNGYCAYCGVHDSNWPHGQAIYQLDHFRPKGNRDFPQFAVLINDFYNLRWCCEICNRNGGKGSHWPSEEEEFQGFGFVDLCEDNWQTHYQILPDGKLESLTKKAIYTVETLLLNTDGYVEHRKKILAGGGSLFEPKASS